MASLIISSDLEHRFEETIRLEQAQHLRARDAECELSQFKQLYTSFLSQHQVTLLTESAGYFQIKKALKYKTSLLQFFKEWLKCANYANEQFRLEAEHLDNGFKLLQNASQQLASPKKINNFTLLMKDHCSEIQSSLLCNDNQKMFVESPFRMPFLSGDPFNRVLIESDGCQHSINNIESISGQLKKTILLTEQEIKLLEESLDQYNFIKKWCGTILDRFL